MSQSRVGKYLPKKREAFVAIKRFMCDGDVTLKVEEETILNRWIYTDALLRAKEDSEDTMIEKIMQKFNVSIHTARKDIVMAQKLFADARTVNKKYLFHHHLQRIDEDIQKLRKKLFHISTDKDGKPVQHVPDSKELSAYAKMLESYTYTLNSIPDEVQHDKQPPPIFQFLLAPGQVIEAPMNVDEAIKEAELLTENEEGVYEPIEEEENDEEI